MIFQTSLSRSLKNVKAVKPYSIPLIDLYSDFLKKLLAENRKIKASEIEKFMTDNILEVKKNQQMNEKCLTFMQGSLQATKCKNEEEKETFMQ